MTSFGAPAIRPTTPEDYEVVVKDEYETHETASQNSTPKQIVSEYDHVESGDEPKDSPPHPATSEPTASMNDEACPEAEPKANLSGAREANPTSSKNGDPFEGPNAELLREFLECISSIKANHTTKPDGSSTKAWNEKQTIERMASFFTKLCEAKPQQGSNEERFKDREYKLIFDLVSAVFSPACKAKLKTKPKETFSKARAGQANHGPEDQDSECYHSSDCDCSDCNACECGCEDCDGCYCDCSNCENCDDCECSDSDDSDNWTQAEDDLEYVRETLGSIIARQRLPPGYEARYSNYLELLHRMAVSYPRPNNIRNASISLIREVWRLNAALAKYPSFPDQETHRLIKLAQDMAKADIKLRSMRHIVMGFMGASGFTALQALERSGIADLVVDLVDRADVLAHRSKDFRHRIGECGC